MNASLASPRFSHSSQQQAQPEAKADPFCLSTIPVVPPLFAPSQTPFRRQIGEAVAKLDAFIQHPSVETAELAQEGAATLCSLMKRKDLRPSGCSREYFRRDFAVASLEQIPALAATAENISVLERFLLDQDERATRRLSDSVLAGITDLNEAFSARLRREYSRNGGLCDRLAQGFADVATFAQEIRKEHQRKTCERFDGSEPASMIQKKLAPVVSKAREAIALVPPERALPSQFEERVANTFARLGDYHFPDAIRLIEGLVGDMRELKHALLSIDGLDRALGNRLELSRSRRSARTAVALS